MEGNNITSHKTEKKNRKQGILIAVSMFLISIAITVACVLIFRNKDTEQIEVIEEVVAAEDYFAEGLKYYYAEDGVLNLDLAAQHFQSVKDNDADAYYYLGRIAERNYAFEEAKGYYEAGEENGSALCAYGLGNVYLYGRFAERDYERAREEFEKALSQGLSEANLGLGTLELYGFGTDSDPQKAMEHLDAATKGTEKEIVAQAYETLAGIYETDSFDIPQDFDKAAECYLAANEIAKAYTGAYMHDLANVYGRKHYEDMRIKWDEKAFATYEALASAGDAESMEALASCYKNGYGCEKDDLESWTWSNKAAELGFAPAMNSVGFYYWNYNAEAFDRIGIKQDYDEAFAWFEKSALAGYPVGMKNTAYQYVKGTGAPQDYEKALEWYEKAANAGDPDAYLAMGDMYRDADAVEQDLNKALEYYNKAAGLGFGRAYARLGYFYGTNQWIKPDYKTAKKYIDQGVYLGDEDCMLQLGALYENGNGVDQDIDEAISRYIKVGDLGMALGYFRAANLYTSDSYPGKNYYVALKYFEKAAEMGYADAMFYAGVFYGNGYGTERDYAVSLEWMQKAKDAGCEQENLQEWIDELSKLQ